MPVNAILRVGLPFRTADEEAAGPSGAYARYAEAIRTAGGDPVAISLRGSRQEVERQARELDAVVLPGAPIDVDPQWYHTERSPACRPADPLREQADFALLDAAFAERKPLLAICYGMQSLNVWLGGRLFQDIAADIEGALEHRWDGRSQPEPRHTIRAEAGSLLARVAGTDDVEVNSSHHQACSLLGRGLRIAAQAPDGVIEAVERAGGGHWVLGVQWHPERMPGQRLGTELFRDLVTAALRAYQ